MADKLFQGVINRGHNLNTVARNSSMLSRYSFEPQSAENPEKVDEEKS